MKKQNRTKGVIRVLRGVPREQRGRVVAGDEHLDQELRDFHRAIRALDKEGVIEAYYQRLLSEIIAADKSGNDKANGRDNSPFWDKQAADADPTRQRRVSPDGEDATQRRPGAPRCLRLAQQIAFFLFSGAVIAAAVLAGVFFVNPPREMLLVWGGRLGSLIHQTQMAINPSKIELLVAIPPLSGTKSATAGQSAVVKATTGADTEAATEEMPTSAVPPPVGVALADKSPRDGVIVENPGAVLSATEANPTAAPASPDQPSATVIAPAVQPPANVSPSTSGSTEPADKSPQGGVIVENPGAALSATEANPTAAPASPEQPSATVIAPAVQPPANVSPSTSGSTEPADKSPQGGVIVENPGAVLSATEAIPAAAVPASPERPPATVIAPAVQPAANASPSTSGSTVVARAATAAPSLPETDIAVLLSRGDASLGSGDVTSARLFYRHAAEGGDGTAALRLGETFDPAFLARAGMATVPGDPKKAASWYRRASELGIGDAALLLRHIAPVQQQ